MVGDYLEGSLTLNGTAVLTLLTLSQSEGANTFELEFLDPVEFSLKKVDKTVAKSWTSEALGSDRLFAKLMPFSEYIALAKRGEKDIIIHYYGGRSLPHRIISTDFTEIVDFKIGKSEKFLYVVDFHHDILAEYHLKEIGCPGSAGVTYCDEYFLQTDLVCEAGSNKFYDQKD